MVHFTMFTCVGLIVCGCTATFHTICVYNTHFTEALYPYKFQNWLFINSVRMCPSSKLPCVGLMAWGCTR